MKINLFRMFILCCFAFCAIPSFSSKTNNSLTIILDWFINPDHAPLFVALDQGYFKEEGLNINIIPPADPSDPPKLVAAGKAFLAITYQPQFVIQQLQGLPIIQAGTLVSHPLNCLVVLQSSTIHSIKDLKGKKIGYSSGGVNSLMLKTMLKHAGLSLDDVQLINVHYNLTQALLSKKVDAVSGMMRIFELIQLKRVGAKARAFYPENYGFPSYSELIFVTNKKNKDNISIQKFMRALKKGVHYLKQHPKKSWDSFSKQHPELNNPLTHQLWFETVPTFSDDPAFIDRNQFKKLKQFVVIAISSPSPSLQA